MATMPTHTLATMPEYALKFQAQMYYQGRFPLESLEAMPQDYKDALWNILLSALLNSCRQNQEEAKQRLTTIIKALFPVASQEDYWGYRHPVHPEEERATFLKEQAQRTASPTPASPAEKGQEPQTCKHSLSQVMALLREACQQGHRSKAAGYRSVVKQYYPAALAECDQLIAQSFPRK